MARLRAKRLVLEISHFTSQPGGRVNRTNLTLSDSGLCVEGPVRLGPLLSATNTPRRGVGLVLGG